MATVGAYEIQGEIGRGAMGRVLKVRHRATGVARAMKVISETASGPSLVARFRRESELLARVGGAAVVTVHEAGEERGALYYVMDLCERGSLRGLLDARRKLPWPEAAALVAKIARALARCHELGVVHRDVKLENVLLDDQGEPRLSDFGCAFDLAGEKLTKTGTGIGTAHYMAPEQLDGQRGDAKSDIYALGVVLYELVTGEVPYDVATWPELSARAHKGDFTRTNERDPATPPALDAILGRALAPKAAARPERASVLAEELEALVARRAPPPAGRRARSLPLGALVAAPLALGLLAAVGFTVAAFTRGPRAPGGGATQPAPGFSLTLDDAATAAVSTDDEPVAIQGRVQGTCWTLELNGTRASVGTDGRFAARVPVTATTREVVATARGPEGLAEARRTVVRRSALPGWFKVLEPSWRPTLPLPAGVRPGESEREYVNEKDGSVLVFVPGGRYTIGEERRRGGPDREPPRTVALEPFFIGKYEVTFEQFEAFVAATKLVTVAEQEGWGFGFDLEQFSLVKKVGASWKNPGGDGEAPKPRDPVTQVSWLDAAAYARWAGLDLPTEEQWETAASWDPEGREKRPFPWGADPPGAGSRIYANLCDDSYRRPRKLELVDYDDGYPGVAPVGSFPLDEAPCGARDMLGNVNEWCRSDDASDVAAETIVAFRGGSWITFLDWPRNTRRGQHPANVRGPALGLRVALAATRRR